MPLGEQVVKSYCLSIRTLVTGVALVVAFTPLLAVTASSLSAQRTRLLSSGVVSSDGDPHEWYTIAADPDNAHNLITCGMTWNAQDNADYGFVYASSDAGATWHLALEDKSSKDVSEESCAFGANGVAYFVADAWKLDEEANIIWPDTGRTRIWVSLDSGRTWFLGGTTGWTDGSSSVVDRSPGPNQNRLYIFFQGAAVFLSSIGDQTALAKLPRIGTSNSSTGLISFKYGDPKVAGPVFNRDIYEHLYQGTHTHQNLILKNGSLLTLFWSKGSKETGRGRFLAAQHTDPKRERLSDPVVLFRVPVDAACDSFLSTPAAYDVETNTIYTTYLDGSNGRCKLMLTTSTDDGQTWSPGREWTEGPNATATSQGSFQDTYSSLALARNHEGVMALLWRSSDTSNCWYFATSMDDGRTYSHPMQLSSCSPAAQRKYHLADAYLGFSKVNEIDESVPSDNTVLMIKNSYNYGENHVTGIAVSPDDVFHPVWHVAVNGECQLRTAAVAVIKPRSGNTAEPARNDGWRYMTNKVKILYGGSQHYDASNGVLTESVIIRNSSDEILKEPLRLEIDSDSRLGRIWPLDVTTVGSGQNISQYLGISQYLPGGELTPGASSAPIPLHFHFELYNDAKPDDNRLAFLSLRLLTKEAR